MTEQPNISSAPQVEHSPHFHTEEKIEIALSHFIKISRTAHEQTGLFSAVDPAIDTPATRENHMTEAWFRDTGWNLVSIAETIGNLEGIDSSPNIVSEMRKFLETDLKKVLALLNQDRWLVRFRQNIIDNGAFTSLSTDAPEMHLQPDGTQCSSWDNNQPECWGELLVACAKAQEGGVISKYSSGEIDVIRGITEYLIKIKPWKFQGTAMWEGDSVHSPASRSNAIIIAKGLDSVLNLFKDDKSFQEEIRETVERTMGFVKEDINKDYTRPAGHEDGADLAMLLAMVLPESEKTALPFLKYVQENGPALGIEITGHGAEVSIGSLPGAIRYTGDDYYRNNELEKGGEARWFMADPVMALGYFKESEKEFRNYNMAKAEEYERIANLFLDRALKIRNQYGYCPELFIPKMDGETQTIIFQPLERSLVWNTALMMTAETLSAKISKLKIPK